MILLRQREFGNKANKAKKRKWQLEQARKEINGNPAMAYAPHERMLARDAEGLEGLIEASDRIAGDRVKYTKATPEDSLLSAYRSSKKPRGVSLDPKEIKNLSLAEKEELSRSLNITHNDWPGDNKRSRSGYSSRKEAEEAAKRLKNDPLFKETEISNALDDYYKERVKKTKYPRKARKATKVLKKAAPYALAGTAIAGATVAGIKIAKKKKAKKEDK